MQTPSFVALSFSIFLISIFVSVLAREHVSLETIFANHRASFQVKQGMSEDKNLLLFQNDAAAPAPLRSSRMNRAQNLRVWSRPSDDGMATVFFVEQIRPKQTMELQGNFLVTPETVRLAWSTLMIFHFCGVDESGVARWFAVHLHEGVLEPISPRGHCTEEIVSGPDNQ